MNDKTPKLTNESQFLHLQRKSKITGFPNQKLCKYAFNKSVLNLIGEKKGIKRYTSLSKYTSLDTQGCNTQGCNVAINNQTKNYLFLFIVMAFYSVQQKRSMPK